jgi:hypothetical protein
MVGFGAFYSFLLVCWRSILAATTRDVASPSRCRAAVRRRERRRRRRRRLCSYPAKRYVDGCWAEMPGSWAGSWAAVLGCFAGLRRPGEPGKSLSPLFFFFFIFCFQFWFYNSVLNSYLNSIMLSGV